MIMRAVMLSPPSATANAAAHTGSIAMITAARDGSICACAQVCSTMVSALAIKARYSTTSQSCRLSGSWMPGADPAAGQSAATAVTNVIMDSCTTLRLSVVSRVLNRPRATM